MNILSRYIFRQAAGAVAMILISLSSITWIAVALRQLENMASQGQDTLLFLKITSLTIPNLIAFVAPIAVLLATLQTLNRLSQDSELIVMTAGGASTWRTVRPLILLALIVSIGVAFVNHFVAPWSQRALRDLIQQARTRLITTVLQPGRFASPERDMTVHIRARGDDGALLGLLMYDRRDPKLTSSYLAEKGYIIRQEGGATAGVFLMMKNGHVLRRPTDDTTPPESISFESYAVDIGRYESRADQTGALRPRERTTPELLRVTADDAAFKAEPGRFRSDLHERIVSPLYALTFVLIAVAFAGQAATTRQNRTQAIVSGFALAILLRVLGIAATNSASVRASAVPLQYLIPLAGAVLASVMITLNMRNRAKKAIAS